MANTNCIVHVWHLTYIQGTSRKFYRVYVTEGGLCFLRWGRIGTAGQHNHAAYGSYDEALDHGLKQVYEKRAKGYLEDHGDLKFTATDTAIIRARNGDITDLDNEWTAAMNNGEFEAAKTEVLKHYADFSRRIQNLLNQAGTADTDTIMDAYESADSVWTEICDHHDEVTAAMGLLKATLMKNLVGA